jgi:YD repeat-containing protein
VPNSGALLSGPTGVAVGPDGGLHVVDQGNNRVRRLTPSLPGPSAGQFLVPSEDGSQVYVFGPDGRQLKTVDALTGALVYQFGYDAAGRLVTVTDGDGNVTTIRRDAAGNPTAIVAPFGQTTTLAVDANGNLASITDPAGKTTQLAYDPGGLLTALTDPNGGTDRATYDGDGRLVRDVEPDGSSKTLSRNDQPGNPLFATYIVTVTDALGEQTVYSVLDDQTGSSRTISVPALGLTTTEKFGTDGSGSVRNPDGSSADWQLALDPRWGMMAPLFQEEDVSDGVATLFTTETRQVTLANPADPLSLTAETDTVTTHDLATLNRAPTTRAFNAALRQVTTTTPAGRTEVDTFDSKGHPIGSQVPGVDPAQYTYDSHGRLTAFAQGTRTETFTYDAQGNLASSTDPLGQTTTFTYDPDGRMTSQTLPDGSQVQYAYDAAGNPVSLTPPGRPAYTFTYTAADQLQSATAPAAGSGPATTQFTYDGADRLAQTTLPDGSTVGFAYNGSAGPGLLSTITLPQGQEALSYPTLPKASPTGQVTGIEEPS